MSPRTPGSLVVEGTDWQAVRGTQREPCRPQKRSTLVPAGWHGVEERHTGCEQPVPHELGVNWWAGGLAYWWLREARRKAVGAFARTCVACLPGGLLVSHDVAGMGVVTLEIERGPRVASNPRKPLEAPGKCATRVGENERLQQCGRARGQCAVRHVAPGNAPRSCQMRLQARGASVSRSADAARGDRWHMEDGMIGFWTGWYDFGTVGGGGDSGGGDGLVRWVEVGYIVRLAWDLRAVGMPP